MGHGAQGPRQNATVSWGPTGQESQTAEPEVLGVGILGARPALPLESRFQPVHWDLPALGLLEKEFVSPRLLSHTQEEPEREDKVAQVCHALCTACGAGREGDGAVTGVASKDFLDEALCCGL